MSGTERLLIHIPHSSTVVPADVRKGILLSDDELEREILTVTDLYTDELFAFTGAALIRNEYCRIVFDPERFRSDEAEPMARFGLGAIYVSTVHGKPMRAFPADEREAMLVRFYDPYHASLEAAVDRILLSHGECLIIDGHSFTSRPMPFEQEQDRDRPDICVGTDVFHTPAEVARRIEVSAGQQGMSTERNFPFAGAITPMKHYRKDPRVRSVMIEINRRRYMDETTGNKLPGFGRTRDFVHGLLEEIAAGR